MPDYTFIGALVGAAVGFLLLFAVVRLAVKYGLRDHQEWLDEQNAARGTLHPPEK